MDRLRAHNCRDLYMRVGEERGINVLERSEPVPAAPTPLPIDWDGAEFTAVVVPAVSTLVGDPEWTDYLRAIARTARARGIPGGLFPVAMDRRGPALGIELQALRWDLWDEPDSDRHRRLLSNLTREFCRMLRHRLDRVRRPDDGMAGLERYLEIIQIFISHSKHDIDGASVALRIRDWFHAHSPLASLFDVHDVPRGVSFVEVLLHQIGTGAVMVVHTDSHSCREWCRREITEAKRRMVPMIVVDSIRDLVPREMPYFGQRAGRPNGPGPQGSDRNGRGLASGRGLPHLVMALPGRGILGRLVRGWCSQPGRPS